MVDRILKGFRNAIIPSVSAAGVEWCPGDNNVWSRLKKATTINEYGKIPVELANVLSATQNGIIGGIFLGTAIYSRNTFMDFMENNRASHFRNHLDAKAELNTRMYRTMIAGGVSWTWRCMVVSFAYSLLSSFIPVIRNKSEWQEFVTAGAVSGTLAGYLFSDRKALGFTRIKQTGRLTYKQLCIGRGLLYGLLMGAVLGANDCLSNGSGAASQLRKWEDHWKQRKLNSNTDVNKGSDTK